MTKIVNGFFSEIHSQKELAYFLDTLRGLPEPKKRSEKLESNEKIPVILSSDDNYACFVATTGVSILYNTNSFIEFYVLSEGISDKNKELIRQSFEAITPHFSLEFVECDSKKSFSSIKLREGYYISLSTCNRLLVPQLLPKLDRAIYLDVDLIVLDDIKKLWDEKLDGHVFGCVPLYYDQFTVLHDLRSMARIPSDTNYWYFNSGVMLIDYAAWRKLKGDNETIIKDLLNIISTCDVQFTPDEIVLNKFAYDNGGYKVLLHKWNAHRCFTYNFLVKNQKILSESDKALLKEYQKTIKEYHFEPFLYDGIEPISIHHFYGVEKPWICASSQNFAMPVLENFDDFWFYCKLTLFFYHIRKMFLIKHMYRDYSEENKQKKKVYKRKWLFYKRLSILTFGLLPYFKKRSRVYKSKYDSI